MKVEITQKGAFGPKGEHEVGAIVDVKGDTVPAYLINKCRPIGKVAVTNPAQGAAPGDGKSEERLAQEAEAKELGVKSPHLMKDETLAAAIAEAKKGGE